MSARECPCTFNGFWRRDADQNCEACNGTGKVWPSVEGEIVGTATIGGNGGAVYENTPQSGKWRVIYQPIEAKEGKP